MHKASQSSHQGSIPVQSHAGLGAVTVVRETVSDVGSRDKRTWLEGGRKRVAQARGRQTQRQCPSAETEMTDATGPRSPVRMCGFASGDARSQGVLAPGSQAAMRCWGRAGGLSPTPTRKERSGPVVPPRM